RPGVTPALPAHGAGDERDQHEAETVRALNRNMNNAAPQASSDPVRHGPQSSWNQAGTPQPGRDGRPEYQPMCRLPATYVAPDGSVYRAETEAQWAALRMHFGADPTPVAGH